MIRAVMMGALGRHEQGLESEMMKWWNARMHLQSKMSLEPENQVGISLSNKFVYYRRLVKETLRAVMIDKKTCQSLFRWSCFFTEVLTPIRM